MAKMALLGVVPLLCLLAACSSSDAAASDAGVDSGSGGCIPGCCSCSSYCEITDAFGEHGVCAATPCGHVGERCCSARYCMGAALTCSSSLVCTSVDAGADADVGQDASSGG